MRFICFLLLYSFIVDFSYSQTTYHSQTRNYGIPQSTFNSNLATQAISTRKSLDNLNAMNQSLFDQRLDQFLDERERLYNKLSSISNDNQREHAEMSFLNRTNNYIASKISKNGNVDKSFYLNKDHLFNNAINQLRSIYNDILNDLRHVPKNDVNHFFNEGRRAQEENLYYLAHYNYKKALKLNPDHIPSLMNISILILDKEDDIINRMNSLGVSREEDEEYERLKKERKSIYKEALPYLNQVNRLEPHNTKVKTTINNILKVLSQ